MLARTQKLTGAIGIGTLLTNQIRKWGKPHPISAANDPNGAWRFVLTDERRIISSSKIDKGTAVDLVLVPGVAEWILVDWSTMRLG